MSLSDSGLAGDPPAPRGAGAPALCVGMKKKMLTTHGQAKNFQQNKLSPKPLDTKHTLHFRQFRKLTLASCAHQHTQTQVPPLTINLTTQTE